MQRHSHAADRALGTLLATLGHSGALLELPWDVLGRVLGHESLLAPRTGLLGASEASLTPSWSTLEPSWGSWRLEQALLGSSEASLTFSWSTREPSWGSLGALLVALRALLRPIWELFGASWEPLGGLLGATRIRFAFYVTFITLFESIWDPQIDEKNDKNIVKIEMFL